MGKFYIKTSPNQIQSPNLRRGSSRGESPSKGQKPVLKYTRKIALQFCCNIRGASPTKRGLTVAPFGISASRNRQSPPNCSTVSVFGYVQTVALVFEPRWRAYGGLAKTCVLGGYAEFPSQGSSRGQSPSKGLVKLPSKRRLWGKTAMACVLIVRTHCSFFPETPFGR